MASRGELIVQFGEQEIATAPESHRDTLIAESPLVEPLFSTGLPSRVKGIYTSQPVGAPETFSLFPVATGTDDIDLVALGAVNRDSALRYFLDTKNGYVVLTDLEAEDPQLEVVNESLPSFIEFLYRIARFRTFKQFVGDEGVPVSDYMELLSSYLMATDSFAMRKETSWWSMVFERAL